MQRISLIVENYRICIHFLKTPSEIHVSNLARAKIKLAKRYAQCHSMQSKQYFIRGVKKTTIVHGNEGGSIKKM